MTYFKNVFVISIFEKCVEHWDRKKIALMNMVSDTLFFKGQDEVSSDFYTQETNHNQALKIIFKEEIQIFLNEINAKNYEISNSWFEKASTGEYHAIHNHGQLGYSAVCYIKYNKKVHTPTQFVSPINDINGGGLRYYSPDIDEGKIIIFPSMLLHFTAPNDSKEERIIVSFNFKVK